MSFSLRLSFSLSLDPLEMLQSVFVDADSNFGRDLLPFLITISFAKYSFTGRGEVWRVNHFHWVMTEEGAEQQCPGFWGVDEIICTFVGAGDVRCCREREGVGYRG